MRWLRGAATAELPRLYEVTLDGGVLMAALVLALAIGTTLGQLSATRFRAGSLVDTLKSAGRRSGTDASGSRLRDGLVVAQLAFSFILLVGSGLMVRTFVTLRDVAPGFERGDELLTFRIGIPNEDVPHAEDLGPAHEALAARLRDIAGVEAVGVTSSVPMDGRGGFDPVWVEGVSLPPGEQPPLRCFKRIGGGYPETMGSPIVAGRAITWEDVRNRARVVVITEGMTRELWGDPERALGRRIAPGVEPGDWREVVGVVGDVRDDGVHQPVVDIAYWPMVMEGFEGERGLSAQRYISYVVRSRKVGTDGFVEAIQEAVWEQYPTVPLESVRTMADYRRDSMARTSFALSVLATAAGVALLLGIVGVYAVMAYAVRRRTQELGIRMALGAKPPQVRRMIVRRAFTLAGIGSVLGVIGALSLSDFLASALYGVGPVDPLTYAVVIAGLVVVASLAGYVPARRAAAVDPAVALRAE